MFFVFPFRIDRPFRMPWATIAIIGTNTIVFLLSLVLGLDWTIDVLGFRMNAWGALTWLSACFLHADILHIAGNMYFLWLFGSVVEDALGPWRLIGVYLAGGLASSLAHGGMMALFLPEAVAIPAIGASGALAAIMGLFAVRFYRTKIRVWYFFWIGWIIRAGTFAITSVLGVALWFARDMFDGILGLALGISGGVANWAHLGGVAFGVGVGLLSGQVRSASTEYLAEDAERLSVTGTHEMAAAKYAELAENDPNNPEWRRKKARELARSTAPDMPAASAEYAEAIRLFLASRRPSDAYDTFVEADGLCGTKDCTHSSVLAVAAEAEKRETWQLAERLYMQLIENVGGTPAAEKALFRLAHVYLGMGDNRRAAMTWGAFGDLHPNSQWMAFAAPEFRALDGA